jgi:hypothetical protein
VVVPAVVNELGLAASERLRVLVIGDTGPTEPHELTDVCLTFVPPLEMCAVGLTAVEDDVASLDRMEP